MHSFYFILLVIVFLYIINLISGDRVILNIRKKSIFIVFIVLLMTSLMRVLQVNAELLDKNYDIDAFSGVGRKFNGLYVKFLDVGNGDCTFIELPNGDDVLIDGGDYYSSSKVVEFLKTQNLDEGDGVNDIDYVINTHPHSDHTAGLVEVLKNFKVNNLYYPHDIEMKYYNGFEGSDDLENGYKINCMNYCYQFYSKMLSEARKQDTLIYDTVSGEYIDEEHILKFVHPDKTYRQNYLDKDEEDITASDYCMFNNDSAVILVSYNGMNILITGDIEQEAEYDIIRKGLVNFNSIDILKVGHHGIEGATTKEFLGYLNPRMAVISRSNYFDSTAIQNLTEKNIMIKETWQDDGIELIPIENGWDIK